jgi:DNA-binding NtrC family response regulator
MSAERQVRILVVDDEPAIRQVLSRALAEAGYEVVTMNDGAAGLNAASSAEAPYDLVVTNNCMPHLSGAQLVSALRERFPDLPIVHLDDLSERDPGPLPPDLPNLQKPFSIERLLEEVARLLGPRV